MQKTQQQFNCIQGAHGTPCSKSFSRNRGYGPCPYCGNNYVQWIEYDRWATEGTNTYIPIGHS